MLTRSQILRALRAASRQLGHAPTRADFMCPIKELGRRVTLSNAETAQPWSAILPTRKSDIFQARNLERPFPAAKIPIHNAFFLSNHF
jgi:hypothetical protein